MDDFNPFRSDLSKTFTMPECLKDRYYISGENGEESWNTDTVTQDGTITLVTVALLVFGYLANSWCRHKTSQQRSEPQQSEPQRNEPLLDSATLMPYLSYRLSKEQKFVIASAIEHKADVYVPNGDLFPTAGPRAINKALKGLYAFDEGYSKENTDQAITRLVSEWSRNPTTLQIENEKRLSILEALPKVHHFDDVSGMSVAVQNSIPQLFPRTISNAAFYPQAAAAGQLVDDEPTSSSSSSQTAGNILPAASMVLDPSLLPPEETVAGLPPPSSSPTDSRLPAASMVLDPSLLPPGILSSSASSTSSSVAPRDHNEQVFLQLQRSTHEERTS